MLLQIKKIQLLTGICLLLQIVLSGYYIPFHLIAAFLSAMIILWQRKFRVLQIQYHYYVIYLYFFRICILVVLCIDLLEMIYILTVIYVGMMLVLISCKTFL